MDDFYADIPRFRAFAQLMEPAHYMPLPDDWLVGVADVVNSTGAIAQRRYKAVNMAGAAIIASVANALGGREFPFVFGGDGASFAVGPAEAAAAGQALAATAGWVGRELDLAMRVALIPVSAIRAAGHDIRVARYAPSPDVSFAMFSGGGLSFADAALKRGEFSLVPAGAEDPPDLTGLSCRFSEIPARRGVILSLLVMQAPDAPPEQYRSTIRELADRVERSPEKGRPLPDNGPPLRWPAQGLDYEVRAGREGRTLVRRVKLLGFTLFAYLIMRLRISVGGFVPEIYMRQVVANSDFRKYDDALRMVIDCTPQFADEIETYLAAAADRGLIRYGVHRQNAAMMTCFTPSAVRSDHVHFIDGAHGGYASAAAAMKSVIARDPEVEERRAV